jgi:hypothetical protein
MRTGDALDIFCLWMIVIAIAVFVFILKNPPDA